MDRLHALMEFKVTAFLSVCITEASQAILYDDDGTIYYESEVQRTQAHQIGG